jgi:hypothetical protein
MDIFRTSGNRNAKRRVDYWLRLDSPHRVCRWHSRAGVVAPAGTWKAVKPRSTSGVIPRSSASAVASGVSPCPSGSTNCSGGDGIYDCFAVISDGSGHNVWVREGYNDANNNGFGYFHFYYAHNLDLGTVETIVENSANGILQSSGRYLTCLGQSTTDPMVRLTSTSM